VLSRTLRATFVSIWQLYAATVVFAAVLMTESIGEWGQNARLTSSSIINFCIEYRLLCRNEKFRYSFLFFPLIYTGFFVFFFHSLSLFLSLSPYVSPLFLLASSVSVILITTPHLYFFRLALWSLVITCGSYVIGHMALIVISFIDEWALVKSCLYLPIRDTWQLWLKEVSSCSFSFFLFLFI